MIPYSAKVKTPLTGRVFKLLDIMEPALSSPQRGLNFGTPRYLGHLSKQYKIDIINNCLDTTRST
jgi:hypothetical protein